MKLIKASVLLLAVSSFAISNAQAAGFEKNVTWGAREAGTAGIGSPKTTGSRALYFNPAGLAQDEVGHEVSLDVSPTWSQFKGPINYQNAESTSTTAITTPLGLMYGGAVDTQLGWGLGYYVSGGNRATFEDVPFPGTVAGKANAKTELTVTEFAAGVGYRLTEDLKIGVAWRGVMANADIAMVSPLPPPNTATNSFLNLNVNGLKASNFGGFKLGAQYKASEKTAMSFVYRSEVSLKGDGTYGGNLSGGAVIPVSETTATGKIIFPMAATLGIQHDYEMWRAMAEYVWTQYSRVNEIAFESPVVLVGGTPVSAGPVIKTDWKDQHSVKLGGEYLGIAWPLRFGYVWTSQVVDSKYARATFSSPAMAHTLTLGTGQDFVLGDKPLRFNTALDYTFSSGSGEGAAAGQAVDATGNATRAGTYSASAYGLHLGVSYAF